MNTKFCTLLSLSAVFLGLSSCKNLPYQTQSEFPPPHESSLSNIRRPSQLREVFLLNTIDSHVSIDDNDPKYNAKILVHMTFHNGQSSFNHFERIIKIFEEPGHGQYAFKKAQESRKFPFNSGRYKIQNSPIDARTGEFKSTMDAWVNNYKLFTHKVMLFDCKVSKKQESQSLISWSQTCEASPNKKDNGDFYDTYSQKFTCTQSGLKSEIRCSASLNARTKKVSVPSVAEFLFGVKSYSAFKAAILLSDSMIRGYYYLSFLAHSHQVPSHLYENAYNHFIQKGYEKQFQKIYDDFLMDEKQFKDKKLYYQF